MWNQSNFNAWLNGQASKIIGELMIKRDQEHKITGAANLIIQRAIDEKIITKGGATRELEQNIKERITGRIL